MIFEFNGYQDARIHQILNFINMTKNILSTIIRVRKSKNSKINRNTYTIDSNLIISITNQFFIHKKERRKFAEAFITKHIFICLHYKIQCTHNLNQWNYMMPDIIM